MAPKKVAPVAAVAAATSGSVAGLVADLMRDTTATLKTMSTDAIADLLEKASLAYFNTSSPLMTDDMFDLVKMELERRAPKHPFLKMVVGAPAEKKVTLPYYMGSLEKIREDPKALTKFVAAYPGDYVLMDKLDGTSALLVYDAEGRPSAMYSRGDGMFGQNISQLLPFIRGVPAPAGGALAGLAVRGELILPREDWARLNHLGANARNVVAGAMSKKVPNKDIARAITLVVYEIVGRPTGSAAAPAVSEDLAMLREAGFTVVHSEALAATEMTMDHLSARLLARRAGSPYEVDGIVVSHDAFHKKIVGKYPKYAFAFKSLLTHDEAEVIVSSVEWNVSKDGYLKPTVLFNPVSLAGVKIQRATGFNAAFIESNVIGPGARIVIIRSGDVIPKIQRVLTVAANGRPALPEGAGAWNDTHVDLRMATLAAPEGSGAGAVADGTAADYARKQMEHFAVSLEMPSVAAGTIKKLYDNGVRSVAAMMRLTAADIVAMEGFQKTSAEKVAAAIADAKVRVTCADLMVASNVFGRGFGKRKIAMILGAFPDIPEVVPATAELAGVKGIGPKTAAEFTEGMARFRAFLRETGLECRRAASPAASAASAATAAPIARLAGAKVVFTGFRAKEWEAQITAVGGNVGTSVSSKTTLVVAADPEKITGKVAEAQKLNLPVMSREAFAAEYGL